MTPACKTCRHARLKDAWRHIVCTVHPVWVNADPDHFCGQYAPTAEAVADEAS